MLAEKGKQLKLPYTLVSGTTTLGKVGIMD